MSRLKDIAARVRRNGVKTNTADFLDNLDKHYILRLAGHKRELKNKIDADGNPVLDCYHPHFPMTASEYARTKKVYALFREQVKKHLGKDFKFDHEVYRSYILILLEHLAREMKIDGNGVQFTIKMMLPLPLEEWLVNVKKNNKKNGGK